MFIVVAIEQYAPGLIEAEQLGMAQDKTLPTMMQSPGFQSFHLGVDRETGRTININQSLGDKRAG